MDTIVDYSPVIDILEDIFGDIRSHNEYNGQISFDCPVCSYDIKELDCGDGKGNLEINYKLNVYKCWSCKESHGTSGRIYGLIKKYGNKKQLKNYLILRPDENDDLPKKVYHTIKLPKEFINFLDASAGLKMTPYYKQAFNYIKERNISDEMIKKFNIGFCYQGHYEHRIIIPSYDSNNHLNYFIARSYLKKTKYKYQNPEAQKEIIIWNEKLIEWDKDIYLVEGVFDSIFVPNSIPMLGKFIPDHLFMKLYDNAKAKIIIILDPDAQSDQEKLYHRLNCGKLMGRIWSVQLTGEKDIADLKGDFTNIKPKQLD
jgi:hypothetical protein